MRHSAHWETGEFVRRHLLCTCSHKRSTSDQQAILNEMSEREKTLTINEIYHSIQGESTWAGSPCVFVRLTFCDLRCNYCDTEYAFYEGNKRNLGEILDTIATYRCPLVEITGGEPLLQKNVLPLMSMLCDSGYTVLLETSGAHDISKVDPRVHRIMDLKTPGSGEVDKNLWSNIEHLKLRRRSEIRHGLARRLRVVARQSAALQAPLPVSCRALLPNFRQDRPAPNCGMDSCRQTERSFSTYRCTNSSGSRRSAESDYACAINQRFHI